MPRRRSPDTSSKALRPVLYFLSFHRDTPTHKRTLRFKTLPMFTDEVSAGVRLRDLMSPDLPESTATDQTGVSTELIFDSWLYPMKEGDDQAQAAELAAASSDVMVRYVYQESDAGQRAVRLLYALSKAPGATLTYDKNNVVVRHGDCAFGIIDGVVESRFCSGFPLPCDPAAIFERDEDVVTTDAGFISLYAEAYRKDDGVMLDALVAAYMGYSGEDLEEMTRCIKIYKPDAPDLEMLERVIVASAGRGSVNKLRRYLVPQWMGKGDFRRLIWAMFPRGRPLDAVELGGLISRLHQIFYKKQKKREEGAQALQASQAVSPTVSPTIKTKKKAKI